MDYNQITVQDCIEMYMYKNKAVVIIAGQVVRFEEMKRNVQENS